MITTTDAGRAAYDARFAHARPRDVEPWESLSPEVRAIWARVERAGQVVPADEPELHTFSINPLGGPDIRVEGADRFATEAQVSAYATWARATIAALHVENDKLRAMLANSGGPCAYCDLPRVDWPKCQSGFPGCGRADDAMLCPNVGASLEADDRVTQLEAKLASLRADKDRLDFLDRCNASLNASYGTTYRWQLVMSHNVNRLLLGAGAVDLHDSAAGNTALPSCREAIDRKRAELARDRSIRSSEGASNA